MHLVKVLSHCRVVEPTAAVFPHGHKRGDNHEVDAEHLGHAFAQQCVTCALNTSPLYEMSRMVSSPQASVSQLSGLALLVPRGRWFGCRKVL